MYITVKSHVNIGTYVTPEDKPVGLDSLIGTSIRYGLDGPRIESR